MKTLKGFKDEIGRLTQVLRLIFDLQWVGEDLHWTEGWRCGFSSDWRSLEPWRPQRPPPGSEINSIQTVLAFFFLLFFTDTFRKKNFVLQLRKQPTFNLSSGECADSKKWVEPKKFNLSYPFKTTKIKTNIKIKITLKILVKIKMSKCKQILSKL